LYLHPWGRIFLSFFSSSFLSHLVPSFLRQNTELSYIYIIKMIEFPIQSCQKYKWKLLRRVMYILIKQIGGRIKP
jgi:hypothetical protein